MLYLTIRACFAWAWYQAMHIARQLINKTREAHSFQLLNLSIEPRHVVAVDPEQADVRYAARCAAGLGQTRCAL